MSQSVSPFTGSIDPAAYSTLVGDIDDLIPRARTLGMFRTADVLAGAVRLARGEIHEAMPKEPVSIIFRIGPVREQSHPHSLKEM
jgi:hypothetical protein